MERVVEDAGQRGRVADEKHLRVVRSHRSFHGVENLRVHARRLVDHEEDVPLVETLEPLRLIRRESEREAAWAEFEPRFRDFAADQLPVSGVYVSNLSPQQFGHLPLRWRGRDDHRIVVAEQPPYDGMCGDEGLAGAVARAHRHIAVFTHRLQNLPLLPPRLRSQPMPHETHRVPAPRCRNARACAKTLRGHTPHTRCARARPFRWAKGAKAYFSPFRLTKGARVERAGYAWEDGGRGRADAAGTRVHARRSCTGIPRTLAALVRAPFAGRKGQRRTSAPFV